LGGVEAGGGGVKPMLLQYSFWYVRGSMYLDATIVNFVVMILVMSDRLAVGDVALTAASARMILHSEHSVISV
jgi:hypothetical protein